jgi:hypothetical protein
MFLPFPLPLHRGYFAAIALTFPPSQLLDPFGRQTPCCYYLTLALPAQLAGGNPEANIAKVSL